MKRVSGSDGVLLCVEALRRGEIVAYPTETFYGLGVDALNVGALEELARLKGRDKRHPFPLLLPQSAALSRYVDSVPGVAYGWIERFWPGPLTIVLRARNLPESLMNPSGGAGFRVSSHPLVREFLRCFGGPVTATSANLSGQPPARSADEVERAFGSTSVVLLDGGVLTGEKPSTVVDLTDPRKPRILREGAVPGDLLAL